MSNTSPLLTSLPPLQTQEFICIYSRYRLTCWWQWNKNLKIFPFFSLTMISHNFYRHSRLSMVILIESTRNEFYKIEDFRLIFLVLAYQILCSTGFHWKKLMKNGIFCDEKLAWIKFKKEIWRDLLVLRHWIMKHDYRLFERIFCVIFGEMDCNCKEFNLKISETLDLRRMSNENGNWVGVYL